MALIVNVGTLNCIAWNTEISGHSVSCHLIDCVCKANTLSTWQTLKV
jgi:hypothetical protein